MALLASVPVTSLSMFRITYHKPKFYSRRLPRPLASLGSSPASSSSPSSSPSHDSSSSSTLPPHKPPFFESAKPNPEKGFDCAFANPSGNPVVGFVQSTESSIERVIAAMTYMQNIFHIPSGSYLKIMQVLALSNIIFDFCFLALLAIGGSLTSSVLCFLNCSEYYISSGKHVKIAQLINTNVYLAGTVMLIFGMGLYGLFISNVSPDVHPAVDRALKGSSLFGMFALKEKPKWMKISSLDELKTKVGHDPSSKNV